MSKSTRDLIPLSFPYQIILHNFIFLFFKLKSYSTKIQRNKKQKDSQSWPTVNKKRQNYAGFGGLVKIPINISNYSIPNHMPNNKLR